jgi:predicted amidophosphoribosyltransferase
MSEANSDETLCRYCHQPIVKPAKVCHHCSRDQRWFWHHFHVGNLVSIAVLLVAIWHFIEARGALDKAREAREATEKLALSSAEIILATLAVDKGRFMDFRPKSLTAPYVRRRVGRLFDALRLSDEARSQHLRVYRAYLEWEEAPENSSAREQAWRELQRLLHDDIT